MKKYAARVIDCEYCYATYQELFDKFKERTSSSLHYVSNNLPENEEEYRVECIVPHLDHRADIYVISKANQAFLMDIDGLEFLDQETDIDYIDLMERKEETQQYFIGPDVGTNENVRWRKVCSGDVDDTIPSFVHTYDSPVSDQINKTQIINRLKFYLEDYELTELDDSMRIVINWFINCTPDYDGDWV